MDHDRERGEISPKKNGAAYVLGWRGYAERGSTSGRFFRLGLGDYFLYQSIPLSVGGDKALNCFFPMPFQKHARITVTNEGKEQVGAIYWNIDYRAYHSPLPADTLYFHAQYRQATPNVAMANNPTNLDGNGNYVWMEASGRGHFVGVTMLCWKTPTDGGRRRRHVLCGRRETSFN